MSMCQFAEHEYLGRSKDLRVRILHRVAQALGVLIKIDGLPYGSQRRLRAIGYFDRLERGGSTEVASVLGEPS